MFSNTHVRAGFHIFEQRSGEVGSFRAVHFANAERRIGNSAFVFRW
jgi:hypothetical protein